VEQRIPVEGPRRRRLAQHVLCRIKLAIPGQQRCGDVVVVLVQRIEPGDVALQFRLDGVVAGLHVLRLGDQHAKAGKVRCQVAVTACQQDLREAGQRYQQFGVGRLVRQRGQALL